MGNSWALWSKNESSSGCCRRCHGCQTNGTASYASNDEGRWTNTTTFSCCCRSNPAMVAVNQQAAVAAAAAAQQAAAQAAVAKQNAPRANYKYAPGVRNPAQVMAMGGPQPVPQQQPQPAVLIQGQEPLTASML